MHSVLGSSNSSNPTIGCSVCLQPITFNSPGKCSCGEITCGEEGCHAYACACAYIDPDPDTQRIRTGLREAIRERFQLASAKALVGDSFSINLEARLVELTNLEADLRAELDMLHLLEDGMVA